MNEKFRKVDTQLRGIFYGSRSKKRPVHAYRCFEYSRDDQIKPTNIHVYGHSIKLETQFLCVNIIRSGNLIKIIQFRSYVH